jgi:hypothetical protein
MFEHISFILQPPMALDALDNAALVLLVPGDVDPVFISVLPGT